MINSAQNDAGQTPPAASAPAPLAHRGRVFITALATLGIATFGSVIAPPAAHADAALWVVTAPGGQIAASVALHDGQLTLTTSSDGNDVVTAAGLGLITSEHDLAHGLSVTDTSTREVHENYTMTTGKRLERTVDQNELTLDVANTDGASMTVAVRASDDGVAFNYTVTGDASYTVTDEPVTFDLPDDARAWLQPYSPQYENEHVMTTAAGAQTGEFGFPATFESQGSYALLTESNVTGTYAASHLTHATGSSAFGLVAYQNAPINASGTLTTPWRVQIVGTAATLVQSTLVDDLAPASKVSDTSWITPGIASWSWFTGGSTSAQADLAFQKTFVDLAAENGWKYALIDEGWKASWVPELVRYAEARGVEIIAWFHSNTLKTAADQTAWFTKLTDWGVKGIKVDFMDSDSQSTFAWYDQILRATADYHLMINFHGATIPKGIQRTWPQIMGYEAVRGEENGRSATRNTILPFTRNVVGSMDYTPVMFTNNTQTSKAHELALPVVFESGWQHMADSPGAYEAEPIAEHFLQNVPTVWDDTRYVAGTPGTDAVIARRSGENWFFGGISSQNAASMTVPLATLGSGSWLVNLITDDGSALAETTQTVTSADTLTIETVDNGGFAMEACPATPGRTSCYQAVPATPSTHMLVDSDSTTVDTGDIVTVRGTFDVRAGGPVTDLSVSVEAPETWSVVDGTTVTRDALGNGDSVSATWKVRVGAGGPRGSVDVPIVGTFTTADGRTIRSAGAATVDVSPIIPTGTVWVSDLDFTDSFTDWGSIKRDSDLNGDPIVIGSTTYDKGIVANANASVTLTTAGACTQFTATLGADPDGDKPSEGTVTFQVLDGEGNVLDSFGSNDNPVTISTPAHDIDVDITGVQTLVLKIGDGGDGINNDHGVFANAKLVCADADTTAPQVSMTTDPATASASGWFVTPVTMTVSAQDADAKLYIEYATDGGDWTEYTAPVALEDGTHTVTARATDSSGNVSDVATRSIQVDATAPVTTAHTDATARTVTLAASDATSGVAVTQYRVVADAVPDAFRDAENTNTVTLLADTGWTTYAAPIDLGLGAASIQYRSLDAAGNAETPQSVSVAAAPGTGSTPGTGAGPSLPGHDSSAAVGPSLAATGSDLSRPVGTGLLALLIGAAILVGTRMQRRTTRG